MSALLAGCMAWTAVVPCAAGCCIRAHSAAEQTLTAVTSTIRHSPMHATAHEVAGVRADAGAKAGQPSVVLSVSFSYLSKRSAYLLDWSQLLPGFCPNLVSRQSKIRRSIDT